MTVCERIMQLRGFSPEIVDTIIDELQTGVAAIMRKHRIQGLKKRRLIVAAILFKSGNCAPWAVPGELRTGEHYSPEGAGWPPVKIFKQAH